MFNKKNENIHPFENVESLEFLAGKNDCGIVLFGSHNKKRPNCVTIVRTFDNHVLDMCELSLLPPATPEEYDTAKFQVPVGMKPLMLFAGNQWEDETNFTFKMIKSMFLDMFKGEESKQIDVGGLQYMMMISAGEQQEGLSPIVNVRWYKIKTKRSGQKLPRVEVEEVGPKFDFKVGRTREADESMMKEAMKQGRRPEDGKTKKNISMDTVGDKIGRVHLGKQDLSGLQTRKMKGLKRRAGVDSDDDDDVDVHEMMELDGISDDELTSKKLRLS